MKQQLLDAWAQLGNGPPRGSEGFRLQLLNVAAGIRIYAAAAGDSGLPAVLLEIPGTQRPLRTSQLSSRAFMVETAGYAGLTPGHIGVLLTLREVQYADLFTTFVIEVLGGVVAAHDVREAADVVRRVVERWRRFVDRGRGPMSDERVRGLLGELTVLSRLFTKFSPSAALTMWTGPQDALRDCELPDASVEVKTFQSDTGSSVRISSPEQLDVVRARPVFLCGVQLARVSAAGRSLPDCVECLEAVLREDRPTLETFENSLAEYGYLRAHAPLYSERFVIENVLVYRVIDSFPRIKASAVPAGVTDVKFSIALSALSQFAVDPAELLGKPGCLEL